MTLSHFHLQAEEPQLCTIKKLGKRDKPSTDCFVETFCIFDRDALPVWRLVNVVAVLEKYVVEAAFFVMIHNCLVAKTLGANTNMFPRLPPEMRERIRQIWTTSVQPLLQFTEPVLLAAQQLRAAQQSAAPNAMNPNPVAVRMVPPVTGGSHRIRDCQHRLRALRNFGRGEPAAGARGLQPAVARASQSAKRDADDAAFLIQCVLDRIGHQLVQNGLRRQKCHY
jgi:hypothetical protein